MNRYLSNKFSPCSMLLDLNVMLKCVIVLCLFHFCNGIKSESPRPGSIKQRDFAFPDEISVNSFPKHFHHHHHPDFRYDHFHHDHSEFPKTNGYPELDKPGNIEPNISEQIPLEVINNINDLDVNDILNKYVEGVEDIGGAPFLNDRFGDVEGEGQPRRRLGASSVPNKAGCIPELRTVKVSDNNDPSILYIPQCTRIERCGGCCSHSLLSCQPVETEDVTYEVFKTQYLGGKKLKAVGKEIVTLERHTKCKCDCKIKPEDCSKYQEYKKSECRCACANYDEEQKCAKNSARKLWNQDLCVCQCRETQQCSTGSYFDQNECKCKMTPFNRRIVKFEKVDSVVPLNEDT